MNAPPSPSVTKPLTGFLLRWIAAWVLPMCVSALAMLACVRMSRNVAGRDIFQPLGILAMLSYPALLAVSHGHVMRKSLRRPILWGVLTGGGVLVAGLAILGLSWPFFQVMPRSPFFVAMHWLRNALAAAGMSIDIDRLYAAGFGLLLGLLIGSAQAAVLGWTWRVRLGWCLVSVVGGWLAGFSIIVSDEIGPLARLMDDAAESLIQRGGGWGGVPVIALWFASVPLIYALPTGLAMRRLLRRRHAAESAAIVARFD